MARILVQVGEASLPLFTRKPWITLRAMAADLICLKSTIEDRNVPAGTGTGEEMSIILPYGYD